MELREGNQCMLTHVLRRKSSLTVWPGAHRASIPVFTAVLAVVIEHQIPSPGEALGLVALTAGVMIAVYEGSGAAGPFAVFLCVLGTVCNAAMMSFSGKLLSEKIDVLRLAFYTAPVSLMFLLPFLWYREVRNLSLTFDSHCPASFCTATVAHAKMGCATHKNCFLQV